MSPRGTDAAGGPLDSASRRDQLAAIAANTTDTFLTVDRSGTIRYANEAARDLLGTEPAELVGRPLTDIIPERHRAAHRTAFRRYLESGERTMDWRDRQLAVLTAGGEEVPVSVSFNEFGTGADYRFVGIVRDVFDRAQKEADLRRSEARFRQLAEELDSVIWMTDPGKTEMLYVNPAYEAVWGRPPESLYDNPTSFIDAIHPEDRDRVEAALDTQSTGRYDEEYRLVRPDGEVRWVRDRAFPIEDDAGEVYRLIGIATDVTERKLREERLELDRQRFQLLQRTGEIGYWEIDLTADSPGSFTVTEELKRLFGVPSGQEFDFSEGLERVHPDDRSAVEEAVGRAIESGSAYDLEIRVETPSGERRWVRTIGEPIVVDGTMTRLSGTFQDITDRKRYQLELERTIERVTDAIVRVDADWRFTFVDDRAAEIYDMDVDALLGRDFWEVFSTARGTRFEREYRRAMVSREPTTFEAQYEYLDGWFLVNVYPDDEGGLSFYFRDVTGRKEYERELEFRTALLEAQAEATIDGMVVVDQDRRVIEYNERYLEIWGLDESFVEGRPSGEDVVERVLDRVADPEQFTAGLEHLWSNPRTERRDEIELADGRWLDRYTAPVVGADGTHYGRLWVFRDVTERREHERALEAHKERLETFASFVSHDLRNPLTVAEGRLEMARAEHDTEHLAEVERALERMHALIDDLMGLARANRAIGDREAIDIEDLARRCWDAVPTDQATLRVETDRTVLADRSRLRQVFENLFRNAVEHAGPDVRVTVGDLEDGFSVEDDGEGVPPVDRDRVFESGVTTERDGTGFGLAIVEQIAEAHGWATTLTEGSDGGARFEFRNVDRP